MRDLWHYPRAALAEQVLNMFNSGLSTALIFFAPRRMGKTEFLLKDVEPLAQKSGWHTFYFSFLDTETPSQEFTIALARFAKNTGVKGKALNILKHIKEISGGAGGISASITFDTQQIQSTMKELLEKLAEEHKILLLLDEIQTLADDRKNSIFIASLRTQLDINKDRLKVIFTGSSREGLRRMFSQSNAPFFHFGQNLPLPELDQGFIKHLAKVFHTVTKRKLAVEQLWQAFLELEKIPQLARSLVERLALHPELDIATAQRELLTDLSDDRAFLELWASSSRLEQLLLRTIAEEETSLFSEKCRQKLAEQLAKDSISVPTVQSALRVLLRKRLIGRLPDRGGYFVDDPNFRSWILTQ